MTAKNCIFCQIVEGKAKSKIIAQNGGAIAINDINPVAKVHVLIIPKKHIDSVLTIKQGEGEVLAKMMEIAQKMVKELNLEAFRLTFNGGKFQHVSHVHLHLLAGGKIDWARL